MFVDKNHSLYKHCEKEIEELFYLVELIGFISIDISSHDIFYSYKNYTLSMKLTTLNTKMEAIEFHLRGFPNLKMGNYVIMPNHIKLEDENKFSVKSRFNKIRTVLFDTFKSEIRQNKIKKILK